MDLSLAIKQAPADIWQQIAQQLKVKTKSQAIKLAASDPTIADMLTKLLQVRQDSFLTAKPAQSYLTGGKKELNF